MNEALLAKLRAYLPQRPDRAGAQRWIGDGIHESVTVQELIEALERGTVPSTTPSLVSNG